ncbi:MAG: PorT family protein [Bacteroidales bacterium]|nr:PorT family protein [Bacteroidales bacterium]
MNVNEFDIEVRKLLQNAEEPVSPAVWDAVAAGLDRKARVIPVWMWSAVAFAAAAAVVAGVFLFKPSLPQEGTRIERVAQAELRPQALVAPEGSLVRMPQAIPSAGRTYEALTLRESVPTQVEAVEDAGIVGEVLLNKSALRLAMPPQSSYKPQVDDNTLLNQLAYAQKEPVSGRGFSLLASGNIQSNSRGSVTEVPGRRAFGAPSNQSGERVYNEGPDNFSLPFSAGLGVKYNFTPRWAIGLGVRYTNLSRSFVADYDSGDGWGVSGAETDNRQHWIGIPLNVYYDIVNRGRWRVHSFAGGSVEYLLDNEYMIHNAPKDIFYHEPGNPFQWSAGLGLGVEFRITPHFGVFLDPSVRYYFDHMNKPRSLRTIQPLRFDIEAGLRFSFGKL